METYNDSASSEQGDFLYPTDQSRQYNSDTISREDGWDTFREAG